MKPEAPALSAVSERAPGVGLYDWCSSEGAVSGPAIETTASPAKHQRGAMAGRRNFSRERAEEPSQRLIAAAAR
jgi:hypothetical protein